MTQLGEASDAQILAFRLWRSGLAERAAPDLAAAAACPASDFARDAALHALAARAEDVDRVPFDRAVDSGELVLAHTIRGAIHAVAPADHALYGRALLPVDVEEELAPRLGSEGRKLVAAVGVSAVDALAEVTAAVEEAFAAGEPLDKNALHDEMRRRVRAELLPWCSSCGSHHVAGMLWRNAVIAAGGRLDSQRRYVRGAAAAVPDPAEAVRRFLHFYGPAKQTDFTAWAGLAGAHGRRLWERVTDELTQAGDGWLLADDIDAFSSPAPARGIRLLPPGDPYLQYANRPLLAPDPELRKRLFRPVASPGVVLHDGRLAGLWRMRTGKAEIERWRKLPARALAAEVDRIQRL